MADSERFLFLASVRRQDYISLPRFPLFSSALMEFLRLIQLPLFRLQAPHLLRLRQVAAQAPHAAPVLLVRAVLSAFLGAAARLPALPSPLDAPPHALEHHVVMQRR